MNICDNSVVLGFIMYFKYIIFFMFLYALLITIYLKVKKDSNKIISLIFKISSILIIIYIILFVLLYFLNSSYKGCFTNSNPNKFEMYKSLTKIYSESSNIESTDGYIDKVSSSYNNKIIGGKNIYIYNQNEYPLSNYEFNFKESPNSYLIKKSGNEVTTLASAISSLIERDDLDPIEIIEKMKYSDMDFSNGIDMNMALSLLSQEYDFSYKEISDEEIVDELNHESIVIARNNGNSENVIFTCTQGYIVIYNIDKSYSVNIISSNDKDFDYICPINTPGFGNIIKADINTTNYNIVDVTDNSDIYYAIWRD